MAVAAVVDMAAAVDVAEDMAAAVAVVVEDINEDTHNKALKAATYVNV